MATAHSIGSIAGVSNNPVVAVGNYVVPWKSCLVCRKSDDSSTLFKSPRDFCRHLRDYHCTKEGGSFVCLYGPNGVCPSLPVDGVSDKDYEDHVAKDHVASENTLNSHIYDMKEPTNVQQSSRLSSNAVAIPCNSASVPSVVQDQHRWTIFMSKVNLPAALNDPRLARRETDFFSKTWGESFERVEVVPSPYLPHITKDHFKKYLSKTSARLKNHLLSSKYGGNGLTNNGIDPDVKSNNIKKQYRFQVDLEVIPKMFLQPGFSLENPETFNAVFPWNQIKISRHDQATSDTSGKSSKLLQEKLSHYLDLVEVQITKQISTRSEAFFSAMISHDELDEHMKKTCFVIDRLRAKVHHLDNILVQNPLKIVQFTRSRSNQLQVYKKLKLMATIYQTQPTIQRLLGTNDFIGALDLIATTQEILSQELVGIQCFRHLGLQLMEMEKFIEKMMKDEFVHFITTHFNQPITESQPPVDWDRLVMLILGSLRQMNQSLTDICEEEASTTIRSTIKHTVIEAVSAADHIDSDAAVTSGSSLANQMRLLDYTQWMALLDKLFENLLVVLSRVKMISNVVQDTAKAITRPDFFQPQTEEPIQDGSAGEPAWLLTVQRITNDADKILSDVDYLQLSKSLRDTLQHINDHAHDRCLKILSARAKDGFLDRLSPAEFVLLSRQIESFVLKSGDICGKRSTSLRSSLQSQSCKFVNRFHEERINKLSLILDNERWRQADVPVEFQEMVEHISSSGKLHLPAKKADTDSKPQEFLSVDGEKYAVVGTVLMLLKMVVEYCQFIDDIPSATPEILNRLVDMLKMFNSRTCQLIIGAGALHLVGLKTISTKNLGLASRCLQLIVFYLPMVKKHFEDHLQPKQTTMLKHFEQLLKDYTDHIAMISAKLVSIMDTMFETNLAKYEIKAPVPSVCFRNIVRQIAKLQEAICDLLPSQQLQELFDEIHSSFKRILKEQLSTLNVIADGGPQHGLVMSDVAFYAAGIRALPGFNEFVVTMDDIWDKS